jgi:hypothetical protein
MQRRTIALLVALAVAVALWISNDEPRARPVDGPLPSAGTAPVPTPSATLGSDDARREVRTASATGPATPPATASYRVRTIDGETGLPLGGATVAWLPAGFDARGLPLEVRRSRSTDPDHFFASHGEHATTAADGIVTIEGDPQGFDVVAHHDGRTGTCALPPAADAPDTVHDVVLTADRTASLRTVDVAGRPAGGLTVRLTHDVVARDGQLERHALLLGPSDAAGHVPLLHAQRFAGADARVTMPGADGEPVAIDPAAGDPIEVVAPPFGALELALLDADGLPLRRAVPPARTVAVRTDRGQPSARLEIDEFGRGRLAPLGCGARYTLTSDELPGRVGSVDGPSRHGEVVRAELRVAAGVPIVTGRLVDADGRPRTASHTLRWVAQRGSAGASIDPGSDGAFRVTLPDWTIGEVPSLSFHALDARGHPNGMVAAARPAAPLVAGVQSVGDLVVALAPILVAGAIQWEDGTPIPDAGPELQTSRRPDDWDQEHLVRPELPGDGRFVMRAPDTAQRYRLQVFAPGGADLEPVEFRAGTTDLVIRVPRAAEVRATFVVDADAPVDQLEIRLRRVDATTATIGPPARERHGDELVARWGGLRGGRHEVVVLASGEPVVSISELDVRAGAACEDPRLRRIDLRGLVRRVAVTVRGPLGTPLRTPDTLVIVRPTEARDAWFFAAPDPDVGVVTLAVARPVDLLCASPGCRAAERTGVFGDLDVRLVAAPTLRVRVDATVPSDVVLRLWATPAQPSADGRVALVRPGHRRGSLGDALGTASVRLTPGADGTVAWQPRGAGEHHLSLTVHRDRAMARVEGTTPAAIDIDTQTDGAFVDVHVDPDALARALLELMR